MLAHLAAGVDVDDLDAAPHRGGWNRHKQRVEQISPVPG